MTEDEFDSLMPLRSFQREDMARTEAEIGRCTTMGIALWGRSADDLQRQLDAAYPEIPPGCDLADLRSLQRLIQKMLVAHWVSPLSLSSWSILIGTQRVTAWEARGEIVRRAIDYLERR